MIGRKASHVDRTFYSLSIDSLPIGWILLFGEHSRWTTGQYSCTTPCCFTVPWDWLWAFPAQLREGGQSPLVDVIYSLSLSIYGKIINSIHPFVISWTRKTDLNVTEMHDLHRWNSDFEPFPIRECYCIKEEKEQ
ncbi:hypothetical protein ACJX0J_002175 [Zea mays]